MNTEVDQQVAFERDTLEAAVVEVMRLAAESGHESTMIPGSNSGRLFDLTVADDVRDYLQLASQLAYAKSGRATAGAIRKVVYRTIGVAFEPMASNELDSLIFSKASPPPIHVAQFWQRLG